MKIRKKIGIWRSATFKNRLPFPIVFNHFVYNKTNKLIHFGCKYKQNDEANNIAIEIKRNGFSLIPNSVPSNLISSIKNKSDALFKNEEATSGKFQEAGLFRIKDCMLSIPEIEDIIYLPHIKNAIHSFYDGGFKIFDADLYRTTPKTNPEASFGSQEWHFDNVTTNMLKLMVYLKDVKEHTGAMKIVPKQDSNNIRKKGFTKRSLASHFEPEILQSCLALEAEIGSVAFFQPQYCIHKAVEPIADYRDVIVFMIYPAINGPKRLNENEKKLASSNRSHIINPFTGKAI